MIDGSLAALVREDPAAIAAGLEATVAERLGARVRVAVATTGSAALASALRAAGRAPSVAAWPCPYASLTHSGDVAVAVALPPGADAAGVGVDVELDRPVRPGMARLICADHERAWLDALPAERRARELLRLWTIKEALYKADPAQGDAIIAEYAVVEPGAEVTAGGRAGDRRAATVVSLRVADATVSVALRPREEGMP